MGLLLLLLCLFVLFAVLGFAVNHLLFFVLIVVVIIALFNLPTRRL